LRLRICRVAGSINAASEKQILRRKKRGLRMTNIRRGGADQTA